jgi:hypothetical protein
MGASKLPRRLQRITAVDVETWFRDAWPGFKSYPSDIQNNRLATRINTIVDRHNARLANDPSRDALKKRRQNYLRARKSARSFQRALQPISEYLQSEKDMLNQLQIEIPVFSALPGQISAVDQMQRALDTFIDLCEPPSVEDHMDPILWIADAAKEAWKNHSPGNSNIDAKKVRLGPEPGGSLVAFIWRALEGIGLAAEGVPGNSRDTIGEHLRGRQNRKRDRRSASSKGPKRSEMPPITKDQA